MGNRLQGKLAFVTAAGQGMGRAAALAMASEGAQVIATDVDSHALEALAGTPGIRTERLDVTDAAAIERAIAAQPPLDVLFNCAGIVHQNTVLDCSDDDWDVAFALNVRSMFCTIRAALPGMLAQGSGSIVNMASVCSSIKGLPNRFLYGTTKAAVLGLTKSVAADYVTRGIRCNAVCPGTVDTPSLQDRMHALGDADAARKMFVARQPMGRLASADEIVPIVVYLASDESSFATGQWFNIDGGITI